jgi:hypothetical protein
VLSGRLDGLRGRWGDLTHRGPLGDPRRRRVILAVLGALAVAVAIWATAVSVRSEVESGDQRVATGGSVPPGSVPALIAPGRLRGLVDRVVAREGRLPRFVTLTFDRLNATIQVTEPVGRGWQTRDLVWNGRTITPGAVHVLSRDPVNQAWSPYEVDLDVPARIIARRSGIGLGGYTFTNAGVFKRALPITDGVGIVWVMNFARGGRTVQVIANAAGAVLRVGKPLGS